MYSYLQPADTEGEDDVDDQRMDDAPHTDDNEDDDDDDAPPPSGGAGTTMSAADVQEIATQVVDIMEKRVSLFVPTFVPTL